ncbi:MAG: UDP-N-acetylglucosamine--N-acetylmuramyl-(pentapeptide) pyrophosphoryl-undecaprenol N-acetylglucosamine transferase [Candidatus Vogelbacteria bacterium]|nr:UDP-N-acetylglucosamine--N-acetylmuramyl-(pentapeptide) pyrophosphoryl-undecaprenol N-acetylglucosamine transferase [Candidatus Vogelbacteria bacterium]
MKILFTGGGTGGHFYPIIAVAEQIKAVALERKLVMPQLYYMSTDPYDPRVLFEHGIKFVPVAAGKHRQYKSILNFLDWFKTAWGALTAITKMFVIYPDVVFGKGGFASFPALFAARVLGIPVIIHDSDSIPGRVNVWAGKFAQKVALSYPEAVKYFKAEKTAVTGNPIRGEILNPIKTGAFEFLDLDPDIPMIFVVGGSLGSVKINDTLLSILPEVLKKYQVIHQVGKANLEDCRARVQTILAGNELSKRYRQFDFLGDTALRMTAGAASLAVSRAGSTIFEFANWGLPAIIIPIPESVSHDQMTNAYTYARGGGAIVIEESNLSPSVLLSEINRLMENESLRADMALAAKKYSNPAAGRNTKTA